MERRSRDDLVFSLFRAIRFLLWEKPYICRMNGKSRLFYPALLLLLVLLWAGNLAYGTVSIPLGEVIRILLGDSVEQTAWQHIVLQSRLPQAVTALLVGASLAVSDAFGRRCGRLVFRFFRRRIAGSDRGRFCRGLLRLGFDYLLFDESQKQYHAADHWDHGWLYRFIVDFDVELLRFVRPYPCLRDVGHGRLFERFERAPAFLCSLYAYRTDMCFAAGQAT